MHSIRGIDRRSSLDPAAIARGVRVARGGVDRAAAEFEADQLAAFQLDDRDPRIAGGFYFARRGGRLQPHINPVSTAFGLQALTLWRQFLDGESSFSTDTLI